MIPIFSPIPQYQTLKTSIEAALVGVAESGQYILGPQVQQFEEAFAKAVGTTHAVGVNSGSDALYLALRALDIGPGDEVITTTFSYIATSESISRTGARPVFVDIDPITFNLDLDRVEQAINERTKAVLPVHLFGLSVDMIKLNDLAKRHDLYIIEDCAQATGAEWSGKPVGSHGHLGCFSFFPTKNLGALGDAGAITTNDADLAARLKSIRVHGGTPANRYDHQEAGINSRLDTLQAAALLVKLPHLEDWNQDRRRIARYYTDRIRNGVLSQRLVPPAMPSDERAHVFHQYTVCVKSDDPQVRNQLQEELKNLGVMAMIYYPIPLHLQKSHQNLGYKHGDFPVSERIAHQVLSLPIFPGLTTEQQDHVIQALEKATAQLSVAR